MTVDTRNSVIAIIAGVSLGVLSWLADRTGGTVAWIGSLAGPWVLIGALLGYQAARIARGALLGAISLTCGVVVYYLLMRVVDGGVNVPNFLTISAIWLVIAPLAGAFSGATGAAIRSNIDREIVPGLASGMVGGLVAGEAAYLLSSAADPGLSDVLVLGAFMVVGVSLPSLLRTRGARFVGYRSLLVFALVGLVVVPSVRFLVEVIG